MSSQGREDTPCTKTLPNYGKVVAHRSSYVHVMSAQGEGQKFPCIPYTVC